MKPWAWALGAKPRQGRKIVAQCVSAGNPEPNGRAPERGVRCHDCPANLAEEASPASSGDGSPSWPGCRRYRLSGPRSCKEDRARAPRDFPALLGRYHGNLSVPDGFSRAGTDLIPGLQPPRTRILALVPATVAHALSPAGGAGHRLPWPVTVAHALSPALWGRPPGLRGSPRTRSSHADHAPTLQDADDPERPHNRPSEPRP